MAEKVTDKGVHIQDKLWLKGSSNLTFLGKILFLISVSWWILHS